MMLEAGYRAAPDRRVRIRHGGLSDRHDWLRRGGGHDSGCGRRSHSTRKAEGSKGDPVITDQLALQQGREHRHSSWAGNRNVLATARRPPAPPSDPRQDRAAAPPDGRGEAALFALTLFLSAALLFTVEPMFAKMVLPLLGGMPAVWNACLVFYQAALLGGYLYAHLSLKWLGPRRQAVLHLALLGLAWIALPIRVARGWLPPATTFPAPWLWMLLAVSLGLPFLAVSASRADAPSVVRPDA